MSDKIGIIDLGLGFDELNEKDQKEYNKAMSREQKSRENRDFKNSSRQK